MNKIERIPKGKELPIIMDGDSVRAILAGRKTQTRRAIPHKLMQNADLDANDPTYIYFEDAYGDSHRGVTYAPYKKDDLLWVKETWRIIGWEPEVMSIAVEFKADNSWIDCIVIEDQWKFEQYAKQCCDDAEKAGIGVGADGSYEWYGEPPTRWRSPVTMPKVAARIWLEVIGVRAERLQDITEADAIAEGALHGVDASWDGNGAYAQGRYQLLWNMLNAKRGYPWEDNPWVWVYEFKVERVGE